MLHRGPDDAGEWWSADGRVGLGHRRLAILDLSPGGHQPMRIPELGLTVVFNGEIYNHLELKKELGCDPGELAPSGNSRQWAGAGRTGWKGTSDTEVLLAAYAKWGTDCLRHLNGMFAFAIYDERKRQLFLARDRAGEKPLFYRWETGKLWFASELKALMAVPGLPRKIDPEALDCYLAFGYVPGEMCILEGYRKMPPAHAMTFDLERGTHWIWQWWRPPSLGDEGEGGQVEKDEELVDQLETLLEDAVAKQLVADVPVGILLSGGTDSSLVTAMAARKSAKVRTFTIGFPGAGKLDETKHARRIAQHFATDHTELMAESATAGLVPRLARQFDEPVADSSMIPTYLVSRLVRQHCTVALGGDGGDELFAGYGHYHRLLRMQQWLGFVPSGLRHALARSAETFLPVGFKGRHYLLGMDVDLRQGLPTPARHLDPTTRRRIMKAPHRLPWAAERTWGSRMPWKKDLVTRASRMDFSTYLSEDILVKVDRAGMLNSLEVRAPFLDYRLIEFAFGKVPPHLKATVKEKKILPKRLAARLLPSAFDQWRKQGFSIPLASWMNQGGFRPLFEEILISTDTLFDPKAIKEIIRLNHLGCTNSERLFGLALFELWRKEYRAYL